MKQNFEGLARRENIQHQIDVCKMYNIDHRANRGKIRQVLDRYHPKSITYQVGKIREETATAKTLRLYPTGGYLPPFIAGQYINLELEIGGIRTTRAYSISSAATKRDYYEITVRRSQNGFASDYLLDEVNVGDELVSSAPTGNFFQFPYVHGKRLVFIAGGSGITPFLSMLETDAEKLVTDKQIDLIYGCAKEDDMIFFERLQSLAAKGLVNLHPVISEPGADCAYRTGFITGEFITEIADDPTACTYFLCGPAAMYDFVLPELGKLAVPGRKIIKEVQTMPEDPTRLAGWPQSIKGDETFTITTADGQSFPAKASETVLEAMERNGIVIPSLCRSGECSACRTKLVTGTVFHPGNELLRKADMKAGYMHPCVTYPISDISIHI